MISETTLLRIPTLDQRLPIVGSVNDMSVMNTIKENNGYYEPEIMSLMSEKISSSDTCIDIGANIGVTSIAMALFAFGGTVYSFEALPQNFLFLDENISTNKIVNCKPILQGLFSKPCELDFCYVDEFAGGSFTSPIGITDDRAEKVKVQCTTLDNWVVDEKIEKIDFIKFDVEGCELDIIQGGMKTLKEHHPKLIIEFNPVGSEKFFGKNLHELFLTLESLYTEINLIQRTNHSLLKVNDFESLIKMIEVQGGLGDLFCEG